MFNLENKAITHKQHNRSNERLAKVVPRRKKIKDQQTGLVSHRLYMYKLCLLVGRVSTHQVVGINTWRG